MREFTLILVLVIHAAHASASSIIYFSTDSYRKKMDNPFLSASTFDDLYVEDFETQNDGMRPNSELTTPNGTGWNGGTLGAPFWGVQEDGLATDQDGGLGHVWSRSFSSPDGSKPPSGIHFDFTTDEQDRLPEYVGAALRGFGLLGNGPAFNIILVYDRNGVEVTEGAWQIPKPVPDPNMPIEDLFLNFEGIYVPGGISRIHFRDFSEVDHLTYGYAIPEPGSLVLAAAGAAALLTRRRSRIRP